MTASRRAARERVLELLYEAEAKDLAPAALLEELPVPPDPYAESLVEGVSERLGHLDALIGAHSVGWAPERMPAPDRAILRMATYELLCRPDVPTAVVISEAVDLAGRYGTDDSGRFVNGVLAAIAAEVRPTPPG